MNVHSSGVLMLCKKRSLVLIIINFIIALSFAIFMYIVVYKGMLQSAILIFLQKCEGKQIMLESSALCSSEE